MKLPRYHHLSLGRVMEPLKVLGEDHPLPKIWQGNIDGISAELEDLLEQVGAYSGVGHWYTSQSKDGIAVVLIHDSGRRLYLVAPEYSMGEEGK
jgi:hypothetical protein